MQLRHPSDKPHSLVLSHSLNIFNSLFSQTKHSLSGHKYTVEYILKEQSAPEHLCSQ